MRFQIGKNRDVKRPGVAFDNIWKYRRQPMCKIEQNKYKEQCGINLPISEIDTK